MKPSGFNDLRVLANLSLLGIPDPIILGLLSCGRVGNKKLRKQALLYPELNVCMSKGHSHSMVAGGLELMSYTTRFTPRTLLMISLEMLARNS